MRFRTIPEEMLLQHTGRYALSEFGAKLSAGGPLQDALNRLRGAAHVLCARDSRTRLVLVAHKEHKISTRMSAH